MRIIHVITIAGLLGATTLAQEFPWEIFKLRTVKEVVSITTRAVRPDDSMFLAQNQLESKAEVVFTGKSRPIPKARKTFIEMWFGILRAEQKEYAELYEREYLYKEQSDEYWLPTSNPITKYFDKELKPGDKMHLYLISIGAYQGKEGIDCVLLVEEFQKPTDETRRTISFRGKQSVRKLDATNNHGFAQDVTYIRTGSGSDRPRTQASLRRFSSSSGRYHHTMRAARAGTRSAPGSDRAKLIC